MYELAVAGVIIVAILALILYVYWTGAAQLAIPVPTGPPAAIPIAPGLKLENGAIITLRADNGSYLVACNNCITDATYPWSARIAGNSADDAAKWIIEKLPGDKVALRSVLNGQYLSRCHTCIKGSSQPNSAFVHIADPKGQPWAQWSISERPGGKVALKADNGNYLARCLNCTTNIDDGGDTSVNSGNINDPMAQWSIEGQ
jgi:hypothetical protein